MQTKNETSKEAESKQFPLNDKFYDIYHFKI